MPLNLPKSASEVDSRSKADVQRELGQARPFLKNSWLGAIVTACSNRIFDFYLQLKAALRENFPDTATGEFLTRWAAIWGKEKLAASKSSGKVVATGIATTSIASGTTFTVTGIGNFSSVSTATISDQTINIDSLARIGTTVTAITTSAHNLANNVPVTIAGASDPEFDVSDASVIVTADNAFQYAIIGSPSDEPGTAATASFTSASVSVESDSFGSGFNLDAGSGMKLQSPIVGVDEVLNVDFGAIGGGTDQESEDSLRGRMLDRIQNPVALFNVAAITETVKEIPGVTRVFVQEVTPAPGQVTVYFMRDNDSSPIPVGSEVNKVKDQILTIKPAHTADADVIVNAPAGVPVDFTFTGLTPNTSTMKTAISANLRQFFDERTTVGVNVDEDAYRSSIFNTVDTVTGDVVKTFTLSTPTGDITIAAGEIGILGSVVYP